MKLSSLLLLSTASVTATGAGPKPKPLRRPNFVLIMSDDQDKHLDSLDFQPAIQKHIVNRGTMFDSHYYTMAQCCPSRVSFFTGRHGHNTNITDVAPPYGKFIEQGFNKQFLPVWLQHAGYNTYYVGKLMNSHSDKNYNKPYPTGFNGTDKVVPTGNGVMFTPPVPADRHSRLYPNVTIPRTKSFNPASPKDISFLKDLPRLNSTVVDSLDEFYRLRLRALASVDDMVDEIFAKLEKRRRLENTHVIYTTDNGFYIGQHRLQAGKTTCYEEDHPTNHVDLAPTIFDLAGIPLRDDFDGAPMPIKDKDQKKPQTYESINVEFWGVNSVEEGHYGTNSYIMNNTYKSVRLIGSGYNLMYSARCTDEHELYNMHTDPYQMNNIYQSKGYLLENSVGKVVSRLNGLMMVLKRCQSQQCVYPWKTLHPKGNVKSHRDALQSKCNSFYEKQMPQVSFDECLQGFIISNEGPQVPAMLARRRRTQIITS
ncbi:alkaline-phosphatase-like protein [Fusarium venenatum]|uniref:alkaline-phosphatase-like protein n=1 Tax=Fusarium venenatum TaxID=56646 RepID=UPI001D6CCD89|nr:alkaline-phosphatase-like protein [Fusarium venenatum]